jgi:hypothetical protein
MPSLASDLHCGLAGAALVSSFVLILLYAVHLRRKHVYPLPPGPPGRFLVGNLGQLSLDHPELDYIRWGREYGKAHAHRRPAMALLTTRPDSDVTYTNVLGQHMICLNSEKAAADLLDRRGVNYCDRPRFTLFEVLVPPGR